MQTLKTLDPSPTSFLNALLREYSGWTICREAAPGALTSCQAEEHAASGATAQKKLLVLPLRASGLSAYIGLKHRSAAGRHCFYDPVLLGREPRSARPIDLTALASLILHEPEIVGEVSAAGRATFLGRLLDSQESLADALDYRRGELDALFTRPLSFIEAEQALLLGHPVHPTPKSHDELSQEEVRALAPEFAAAFPLRWMLVHRERLDAGGTEDLPLRQALTDLIASDDAFPAHSLTLIENAPTHLPMPMHPWQAEHLLAQSGIKAMLANGDLIDLGTPGSSFHPTSSVRTLYAEHADYMLKFSLSVRLTNSVRVLLPKEWERGKQIHQLFATPLWQEISKRFPSFRILSEPVHMALKDSQGATIRESAVLFRQNPFKRDAALHTEVLATLCQDHPEGGCSRITALIRRIALREGRSEAAASLLWFDRFLKVVLAPFLQIHADYGLLFGAHQQNTVLSLQEDYPLRVYYRDCQGTGHSDSAHEVLKSYLPGIGGEAQNTVSDELGDRLYGYYLIVNNLFNVIASIAQGGSTDEASLFASLREFLLKLREEGLRDPRFVTKLLEEETLWSKGNFLTCLRDINESHEGQDQLAVYVPMANPIYAPSNAETSTPRMPEARLAKTG
ncbi:IucA/IucC family protein [Denitrobaculum tricleocarpae]|nr:IucA/IucC family protein [Denitrobaculum tricleocarpae]